MKWIDANDIKAWANRRNCQETLPLLVRKLIRNTSKSLRSIKFPSGESVLLGGWDGILEVSEETEYLPMGTSLWEFGANKDVKKKADEDYKKRTANPLDFNPAESTFVFVTPRVWQNANDWIIEKKQEGIWKDIRVLDADALEEWLDVAPTVGAWLAKHINKYPSGGIQPTDDFWEEWTSGTKLKLNAEILLGGRKKEQETILELLQMPGVNFVQGISREESLAFIVSCFKNNQDQEEDFFSRSLIVDDPETFRELAIVEQPLILLPRFEDNGVINRAVANGHTVIIPVGADSASNWSNKIALPRIDRESFISALIKTGMTREFAERFSKESARNITILRRQLEFTRTLPTWSLPENVSDLIPALIVGRWDENFEKDRKIISEIANMSYEDYAKKATRWLHTPDSPLVKIGSTWRLASPFDAWTNASKHITRNNFELLHKAALEILSEIHPAFQLESDRRHVASIYGKNREFSEWIREGIIQSLILTSIFGDKLKFDLPIKADQWIDKIVTDLLSSADPLLWKSIQNKLPLIAEASPVSFLDAIEKHLSAEKSPVAALFEEDPGFMTPITYHTGLLWALESLAWFPQYLSRTSLILAKLSEIDPGGKIVNRPINSLSEIFKPWHYQTLASFEERMQVLKLMSEKIPEIAWAILIRMLPDSMNGIGMPTQKTRWRMFDLETENPVTYKEIYDTHSAVVNMLLSIFDFTETKLAKLIEESVNLLPHDRDKVLSFVESIYEKVTHSQNLTWHEIRKVLSHHRSFPNAGWALPESELLRFEKLYQVLTPVDDVAKSIWMFDDHWPGFPDGHKEENSSYEERGAIILTRRIEGLSDIYQKFGLQKIITLSEAVKEPWILGDTLAHIINSEEEVFELCELLAKENSDPRFVSNFIFRKCVLNGQDWVFTLYEKLRSRNFDNSSLAKLLIPINQTQGLWNFIESTNKEVIQNYWNGAYPHFYSLSHDEKIYGLKKLIEHNRFLSALDMCSHFTGEVPSDLILEILEKTGTVKTDEALRLDAYRVNKLFEELDKRSDYDVNSIYKLEWIYLPLLAGYGSHRKPKRLHDEMSRNPEFFMEVLKMIYKPDDETRVEEQKNGLSDDQLRLRAEQAFELLHSWKQVPGVDNTGQIDSNGLKSWVEKVRELATLYGRIEAADIYIGKILAQYPERPEILWPPNEICDVIETINTDAIKRNFSAETFNKRGSSVRGAFDGGDIERGKASYFQKLAEGHKNKYPSITRIFENLAKGYEQDAKRMDESAERDGLEY